MDKVQAADDVRELELQESVHTNSANIRLLTYNTWGLKYVSKYRRFRLCAIADRLANAVPGSQDDYDIVALQEVWCSEDWEYLSSRCENLYPYRRNFKSGIITGPGLCILSKVPIKETFLYRFPINGRPSAFFRGDWMVGKSISVTLLQPHTKGALPIALLNSHMHAPYALTGDAAYSCHRACQAWDFTKLVRMLKRAGYAVVQVGDLNSRPGSLPYKLFTVEGGLEDSWDVLGSVSGKKADDVAPPVDANVGPMASATPAIGPAGITPIAEMSPEDQILIGGVTCNSTLNTWRANRRLSEACRLDYALIDKATVLPINAAVRFTEVSESPYNCSLSDHFAYSVELQIANESRRRKEHRPSERIEVYQELKREIETYLNHTIPFQAQWRKWHFIGSFVLIIIIHIGMTWAAQRSAWSTILLLLASTIIGITGAVNGLIWFLGVRSEKRALLEVKSEVEDMIYGSEEHPN